MKIICWCVHLLSFFCALDFKICFWENKKIEVGLFYYFLSVLFILWQLLFFALPVLWIYLSVQSVQLLSRVWLFATPWITARQASLSITNSRSLLKHVHRVSDAIQPSHPLSSPFPPAPNPSQHQSLFQWVDSSYQVAKELELQLQHQSFQWIFRVDFL